MRTGSTVVPEGWMVRLHDASPSPLLLALFSVATTLLLVSLSTRLLTGGRYARQRSDPASSKSVDVLPTWFPLLGHAIPLAISPDRVLRAASERHRGVFALSIGRALHNIVHTPALIEEVLQQRAPVVEQEPITWFMLVKLFGAPPKARAVFAKKFDAAQEVVTSTVLSGPHLKNMLAVTLRNMEVQIPNFLSFAPSLIDQNLWERVGDVDIVGDVGLGAPHGEVADVNLLALVREFIGHVSMPTLMGQSFLENFPNTLQDLWMFDRGIKYLALGFPRWLPARAATQAHLARARLLYSIRSFHRALNQANAETPSKMEWGDMDDVSELMERRAAIWREGTVTPDAAAAADLSLLWAMTVNANTLCFWLILRILSTPGLLDQVREESSAYVTVSPPESIRGVTELARLKLADEGLVHDCPLFRACYLETLRLHSGPWSVRKVARDWELGRGPAGDDGPPQSFVLSAGSFVEIPHGVHHADPRYFDRPETFDPARFLVPRGTGDGKSRVEIGSFRPYGGGASTCKGRVFAERACLAYVAGLLALWEFRPVQRGGWVLPSARPATAVSIPTRDVRVRVSRRV